MLLQKEYLCKTKAEKIIVVVNTGIALVCVDNLPKEQFACGLRRVMEFIREFSTIHSKSTGWEGEGGFHDK